MNTWKSLFPKVVVNLSEDRILWGKCLFMILEALVTLGIVKNENDLNWVTRKAFGKSQRKEM